ncbi:hypothetical protein [Tunturiibacter gelidoferens]|uniref:Uncharacterized protein n=1 Tax=Tunturiibacter gelidiferens TaxID=3069689 RepID=A0ACC5P5D6_9BACT|nr:hypothetical protein [Edaphobacter lichenicola]MBB5342040.1 hypothetical protein [Edaphobacter lichenicola]
MTIRSLAVAVPLALSFNLALPIRAEEPVQKYFRANDVTPIVKHSSYIVPGGFVIVDWVKGGAEYYDPRSDGKKLSLDLGQKDTESMDKVKSHKETSVDGAFSGIALLLGYKPALKISNASTFDFSGVTFRVSRISDEDIDNLINNDGASKTYMLNTLKVKVDLYIVQAVDYTDSFSLTTSSSIEVGANSSGSVEDCKVPPEKGETKPKTNAPDQAANPPAGGGKAANAPAGGDSKQDKLTKAVADAKTVEQLIPATKTATDAANAGTRTASALPAASLKICRDSGNTTTFKNDVPVPTAMHLVYVTSLNGSLSRRLGAAVTVPMGDPRATTRNGRIHREPTYWSVQYP